MKNHPLLQELKGRTERFIIYVMATLLVTSCGVKGPPEPPLPSEASTKVSPTVSETTEPVTAPPVIFPTTPKKKKPAKPKKGP